MDKTFTLDEVAQILTDMFGDCCACNYNDIDEWLPQKCKYGMTDCPDPPDHLGCWKEYLIHIKESDTK